MRMGKAAFFIGEENHCRESGRLNGLIRCRNTSLSLRRFQESTIPEITSGPMWTFRREMSLLFSLSRDRIFPGTKPGSEIARFGSIHIADCFQLLKSQQGCMVS